MIYPTSFTVVLLALLFSQLTRLSGLLFIAMILQATSILNIETSAASETGGTNAYGITPFNAIALICICYLFIKFIRKNKIQVRNDLNLTFILLIGYVLVSVLSALILPKVFEGMPVNLLVRMDGGNTSPQPLYLSISNYAQSINIVVLFLSLIFLMSENYEYDKKRFLIIGVILAWFLVVCVIVYEQLAGFYDWNSLVYLFMSNPGYSQSPLAPMGFIISRVGLPFSEPSYASAYLSAMTIGFSAVAYLGVYWKYYLLAAIVSLIALINTLGSTGIFSFIISYLILMALSLIFFRTKIKKFSHRLRICSLVFITIFSVVLIFISIKNTYIEMHVEKIVNTLIINKIKQEDGQRERSNKRAVEIIFETHGLGVGLGSNRASSFFASLLSNTGVVGFSLFMGMLGTLLWRYWRAPSLSDVQIFVGTSLPAATLAMGIGIPDLNMPMYWGFIFLGFVFCPGSEVDDKGAGDGYPTA